VADYEPPSKPRFSPSHWPPSPNPPFQNLPTPQSLEYTHAVVRETLRLYPAVATELKSVAADDVLPGGTKVSAGSFITFSPYVMGRLEELWEDPLRCAAPDCRPGGRAVKGEEMLPTHGRE
jgi:cytochrome P450